MDLLAIEAMQWAKKLPEVEGRKNPKPAGSGVLGSSRLVLNFLLPCGPGRPFSQDESILHSTYPEFKIKEILAKDNLNSLGAFINDKFCDITELEVHFRLSQSVDDNEVHPQLDQCLNALLHVTDQCAFAINAKYYMSTPPTEIRRANGTVVSLPYHKANTLNNQASSIGQPSLLPNNGNLPKDCTVISLQTRIIRRFSELADGKQQPRLFDA
jgi:hypothetical protein